MTGHDLDREGPGAGPRTPNERKAAAFLWQGLFTTLLLLPPLLVSVVACDSKSRDYRVDGKVTIDGEPAKGIRLRLHFDASGAPGFSEPPKEAEDFTTTSASGEYVFRFASTEGDPHANVRIDSVDLAGFGYIPEFTTLDWDSPERRAEFDSDRVAVVNFAGTTDTRSTPDTLRFVILTPRHDTTYTTGTPIPFTVSAYLFNRSGGAAPYVESESIVWTSSIDGQIGTGSFSRELSAGAHTVVASIVIDTVGLTFSGTDTVAITVTDPGAANESPAASIQSPADGDSLATGVEIAFAGTGTDPEDGALSGGALVWSSSLDGQIGTGTAFTRSDLSAGTHTITLTATDSDGATGTSNLDITVTPPTAGACADFNLTLDFDTIQVAAGTADQVIVFVVDRVAGFTGAVELMLTTGPGGTDPNDVLSTASFAPNPVGYLSGDVEYSVLSFTPRTDVSAGASYDLEVAGASPLLEQVPPEEWCRVPVTFEVIQ